MNRRHLVIRRTTRALAFSRLVLAASFLLAVWLEPTARYFANWQAFGVLCGYMAWAALAAVIAWRSWWWEFRLAWASHLLDTAVFVIAVTITETRVDDFRAPFMAFAAFLLISATLRWGERAVALTSLLLVGGYGATFAVLDALHIPADVYQTARRLIYMIGMSLMMVWLAVDRRIVYVAAFPEPDGVPGKRRLALVAGILAHARAEFDAPAAAIALTGEEEPWIDLYRDTAGVFVHERIGPGAMTEDFARENAAALFDSAHGHRIVAHTDMQLEPVAGRFDYALARACGVSQGLIAGFASASGHGQILVAAGSRAGLDDLPVLAGIAREIGQTLDREDMAAIGQAIAVSEVRTALARDLHDSIAQFLAGAMFRLEALRRWIRDGHDPDPEILAIKEALRTEQGQLRALIGRLRRGVDGDRDTDLVGEIDTLVTQVGHHWGIAIRFKARTPALDVSIALAHELRQLVREAVANAARHAQCRTIDVVLERAAEGWLRLVIADDGRGFAQDAAAFRPQSIAERVDSLGGRLHVGAAADSHGARLEIEVPLRGPVAA